MPQTPQEIIQSELDSLTIGNSEYSRNIKGDLKTSLLNTAIIYPKNHIIVFDGGNFVASKIPSLTNYFTERLIPSKLESCIKWHIESKNNGINFSEKFQAIPVNALTISIAESLADNIINEIEKRKLALHHTKVNLDALDISPQN